MIWDIMETTSVVRLKGILQSRYGKNLELSFINDSSSEEVSSEEGFFSVRNGTLHIPIHSDGKFLAIAKVAHAEDMPLTAREAVVSIVKLILEPAIYNWFLENSQQNTEIMSRTQEADILDGGIRHTKNEHPSRVTQAEPDLVLLRAHNPHHIGKMALRVHEQWQRWAFLSWADIRAQIATPQDIRDLGKMTIFIDDVLNLSEDEKFLINEWFKSADVENEPALILGTTQDWMDLHESKSLPNPLLEKAGFAQIDVDKLPADRRLSEEALQLMLDKSTLLQ